MTIDNWVQIGECKKPHGIKGEFSFYLFNGEESVLSKGHLIKIQPLNPSSSVPAAGKIIKLIKLNKSHKVIANLEGITDRNEVEAMLPFSIWLRREDFPAESDDEYYIADLVGLNVLDLSGEEIGTVHSFYENGAQVVLVITFDNGSVKEIPFVEVFFPEVDIENGFVKVIIPEDFE